MTEINRLLQKLCEADIEFVIVGGFAAMLHGSSMLTRDLDVCALLTDASVEKLRAAFRDLHPTHRQTPQRLSFLDTPDPGVALKNVYLQTDLGPLDVMSAITGIGGFESVKQNAVPFELFGHRVFVMGLEDLIKAKEALGRHKDLLVAEELKIISDRRGKGSKPK